MTRKVRVKPQMVRKPHSYKKYRKKGYLMKSPKKKK